MMPGDPMGLSAGYGAAAMGPALEELVKQSLLRQAAQREQAQMILQQQRAQQQLELQRQGLEQDASQFGQTHGLNMRKQGHDETVYADEAPVRAESLRGARITNDTNQFESGDKQRRIGEQRGAQAALEGDKRFGPILRLQRAGVGTQDVDPEETPEEAHGRRVTLERVQGEEARKTVAANAAGAAGRGERAFPAGVSMELASFDTVSQLANEVLELGKTSNWAGVGGMKQGAVKDFAAKNFGVGSDAGMNMRNKIDNILGEVAKIRGGAALTPQEKALIERYTPTINDHPRMLQNKLQNLQHFIATKKAHFMSLQGVPMSSSQEMKTGPASKGTLNRADVLARGKELGMTDQQAIEDATAKGYDVR